MRFLVFVFVASFFILDAPIVEMFLKWLAPVAKPPRIEIPGMFRYPFFGVPLRNRFHPTIDHRHNDNIHSLGCSAWFHESAATKHAGMVVRRIHFDAVDFACVFSFSRPPLFLIFEYRQVMLTCFAYQPF
jgi:hypothetical protein